MTGTVSSWVAVGISTWLMHAKIPWATRRAVLTVMQTRRQQVGDHRSARRLARAMIKPCRYDGRQNTCPVCEHDYVSCLVFQFRAGAHSRAELTSAVILKKCGGEGRRHP